MIDLEKYRGVFDSVTPWAGQVRGGWLVDFLGIQTRQRFLPLTSFSAEHGRDRQGQPQPPTISSGEIWFEAVDWVESAREAVGAYVMVTLGANYGAQAVGAATALRTLNPMPYRLVAVEPVPENFEWTKLHMRDNGIDPNEQWLIRTAIANNNDPVLFPIGSPGSGAQNSFSTNEIEARKNYARELARPELATLALSNLLVNNTTGLVKNLVEGYDLPAEIKIISALTLADIVAPFEFIDYIESDIQQSEILVFPPCIDMITRRVKRIHIGTHGEEVHEALLQLFIGYGWQIIFNFAPNSRFETTLGSFHTNDGVLTVRNPHIQRDPAHSAKVRPEYRLGEIDLNDTHKLASASGPPE